MCKIIYTGIKKVNTFVGMNNSIAINPFLQSWRLRVLQMKRKRTTADTQHINDNDGVILEYTEETVTYTIEQQAKCSVYRLPYIDNVLFGEIDNCAKALFLYIIYHIPKDKDYISLSSKRVCSSMNISRPTLVKSIRQLCDIGLLCKKPSLYDYWVNPEYLFNGNRIKFAQGVKNDIVEIVELQ
jgi:hypothetical protein